MILLNIVEKKIFRNEIKYDQRKSSRLKIIIIFQITFVLKNLFLSSLSQYSPLFPNFFNIFYSVQSISQTPLLNSISHEVLTRTITFIFKLMKQASVRYSRTLQDNATFEQRIQHYVRMLRTFNPLLQSNSLIQLETIIPSADFQFSKSAKLEESNLKSSLLPFFKFRNFDNEQRTLKARIDIKTNHSVNFFLLLLLL